MIRLLGFGVVVLCGVGVRLEALGVNLLILLLRHITYIDLIFGYNMRFLHMRLHLHLQTFHKYFSRAVCFDRLR